MDEPDLKTTWPATPSTKTWPASRHSNFLSAGVLLTAKRRTRDEGMSRARLKA